MGIYVLKEKRESMKRGEGEREMGDNESDSESKSVGESKSESESGEESGLY